MINTMIWWINLRKKPLESVNRICPEDFLTLNPKKCLYLQVNLSYTKMVSVREKIFSWTCESGRGFKVMIVTLIEKFTVSCGRPGTDSASGRKLTRHLASDHFADPDRNLLYDSDAISSDPSVSGYGRCTG